MVKVIRILALEAAPGLNLQRRNALTVALSKIGFPVLEAIAALVTFPLDESISTTQTPLPVTWRLRASYGYSGFGAYRAAALAPEALNVPGLPACGALIGANFCVCGFFGGGVVSSTYSGLMSGGGGGSGNGISSGGGVGSSLAWSVASTVAVGMSGATSTGTSRFVTV